MLLVRVVLLAAVFAWPGSARGVRAAVDQGWPRQKQQDGNTLVYYQPQLDSWKDQKVLKARMAVVLTLQGQKEPIAGAVWLTADTDADLESRTVALEKLEIEKTHFSVLDEALAKKAEEVVKKMLPGKPVQVSLDRILTGLKRTEEAAAKKIALKNDPPQIFVSFEPARLLIFDGEPLFAPVAGTNLQYAVNTNWTLFTEKATSSYLPAQRRDVADYEQTRRSMDTGKVPARRFCPSSQRRQFQGRPREHAAQKAGRQGPEVLYREGTGRADRDQGKARAQGGRRVRPELRREYRYGPLLL